MLFIFARTGSRALVILGVTVFALCGLDVAALLTVALPGTGDGPLLPHTESASRYFSWCWHGIVPFGALAYALARPRRALSPDVLRRIVRVVLPYALAAIVLVTIIFLEIAATLPPIAGGTEMRTIHRLTLACIALPLTVAALAAMRRVLASPNSDAIDVAVALFVIVDIANIATSLINEQRFDFAWTIAHVLRLFGSTFVWLAATLELVNRLTDRARAESVAIRAQAATQQQNLDVQASLVKSRFVTTISHELRTPLGGIIGMTELIGRTNLTEQQRSYAEAIRSSSDTLLRIVNDLLEFSRADAGRIELETLPLDLHALVDEVLVLYRPQAALRNVTLDAFVDPSVPRTIYGDPLRIKQVSHNLLNNAVRFTEEGSIRIEVAPVAAPEPRVRFSVHDTGIGISGSARARIFDAFTQADTSTSRRFGGTGLGLAIARHLAQLMGGTIDVRSVVGVGSTFSFTIPLHAALESVADAPARPALPGSSDVPPGSRSERILIAEDNEINARLLVAQLEHLGFTPDVVLDGTAAIAAAARERYDLIFMDCHMPGVDGFDATRHIRGSGSHARPTAIIAVSADPSDEQRDRCRAAGFDDFLAKPALLEPLSELVQRWVRSGSRPASSASAPELSLPAWLVPANAMRERLRGVFRNDEARITAVIDAGRRSLRESLDMLAAGVHRRDSAGAGEAAHKIKGTALELGLTAIAATAGSIESAAKADRWPDVEHAVTGLRADIDDPGLEATA